MGQYIRYGDVAIGDVFPPEPLAFHVSPSVVDAFVAAIGADDGAIDGGGSHRRVPSMIAAVYLIDLLMARRSPPGGIHAKQAIRFHRPIATGETLSIQGTVIEKYVRKERPYVVAAYEARGTDGSLVSSGRVTSIWGPDQ